MIPSTLQNFCCGYQSMSEPTILTCDQKTTKLRETIGIRRLVNAGVFLFADVHSFKFNLCDTGSRSKGKYLLSISLEGPVDE